MSEHHCHARFCSAHCKPEWLMCYRHWKIVPRALQLAVWATYRPGQCDDKKPSPEWFKAADDAIAAVFEKERAAGTFALADCFCGTPASAVVQPWVQDGGDAIGLRGGYGSPEPRCPSHLGNGRVVKRLMNDVTKVAGLTGYEMGANL